MGLAGPVGSVVGACSPSRLEADAPQSVPGLHSSRAPVVEVLVTADRAWLLRDSMRLEDAEPDHLKPLWIMSRIVSPDYPLVGDEWEEVLIVEALTAPGARAVADTLGLLGDEEADLKFAGPVTRSLWPEGLWYRWLEEEDVTGFLSNYLPPGLPKVSP